MGIDGWRDDAVLQINLKSGPIVRSWSLFRPLYQNRTGERIRLSQHLHIFFCVLSLVFASSKFICVKLFPLWDLLLQNTLVQFVQKELQFFTLNWTSEKSPNSRDRLSSDVAFCNAESSRLRATYCWVNARNSSKPYREWTDWEMLAKESVQVLRYQYLKWTRSGLYEPFWHSPDQEWAEEVMKAECFQCSSGFCHGSCDFTLGLWDSFW